MKYAIRANVLCIPVTEQQCQDVTDMLNSRSNITVDRLSANPVFSCRLIVEARKEMLAMHYGIEALMGALAVVTGWEKAEEKPHITFFSSPAEPSEQ